MSLRQVLFSTVAAIGIAAMLVAVPAPAGAQQAAVALELLNVRRCVPCHYGTFPLLHGTPDELRKLAPNVEILAPEPGETVEL